MAFGSTPVSTTSLSQNQFPASSVAVPNHAGGNFSASRGANPATDSNGNETADVSVASPDGAMITIGATTDASVTGDTAGTVSAKLRGMNKIWAGVSDLVNNLLHTNIKQVNGNPVVTGGANGLLAVGGPVASGAANADNPVKQGGVFNTTQPTVTNGQVVDLQSTARGARIVATGVDGFTSVVQATAGTALAADQTNSELRVSNYVKTTTAGDTALTLGQAAMANSLPVAIASNQGAIGSVVAQAVAGTALAADQTNSELRVSNYVKTTTAGDTALTLGQATMANSLPVALASNQNNLPFNLAQVLGAALSNTNPVLTEPNIQNWIRSGQQGYFATTDVYTPSAINNAFSIFNPNASGKTLIIISLTITYGAATQVARLRITNSNPSFANTLTNANFDLGNMSTGGGVSPVASVTYATASTSVPALSAASIAYTGIQTTTTLTNELMIATAPLVLAANTGLAAYFTNTAAGNLCFSVKWIEV